jgi:hypothetical protein
MAVLAIGFSTGLIQSVDGTHHSTCGCAAGLIFHFLSCPLFLLFWERTPWHHMRLFMTLHDAFMTSLMANHDKYHLFVTYIFPSLLRNEVSTGRAKWPDHFHDGLGQNDWGIRSVMIHEPFHTDMTWHQGSVHIYFSYFAIWVGGSVGVGGFLGMQTR